MLSIQSRRRLDWVTRHALAIALFLATFLLCIYIAPRTGPRIPLAMFLPAILLASWFCGTSASILTTILSLTATDWLLIGPRHSLRVVPPDILQFSLHAAIGLAICWYGHANRVARARLQRSLDEAHRLREEYQSLFELSAAAQAEVDASSGRFVRVNSRLCTATGYTPAELLSMRFLDLTHPDDRADIRIAAAKLLDDQIPVVDVQKRCVCKNGEIIDAFVSATVIRDSSGRPKKMVAAIRDITLQKRIERALRYAQEGLEHAVVERTSELRHDHHRFESFCSSMGHDLRAPLRAMHNFATLLSQRYGILLPEQGKAFTERLAAASLKMDQLLIDLLEYGKVSYVDIFPAKVDLEELVHNIIEQIHQTPLGRSAEFIIRRPIPPVHADPRLLDQALRNLVTNGLKFNPSPHRHIQIGAEHRGLAARIYVQDDGPGIPKKYHHLIFGLFQRLDESDPNSTGIGLAIVRTAAERMHGKAGVESAPGKGSRFWLELPKAL